MALRCRSLWAQCNQCRHTTVMNVNHLPGDLTLPHSGRAWCAGGSAGPSGATSGRSGSPFALHPLESRSIRAPGAGHTTGSPA